MSRACLSSCHMSILQHTAPQTGHRAHTCCRQPASNQSAYSNWRECRADLGCGSCMAPSSCAATAAADLLCQFVVLPRRALSLPAALTINVCQAAFRSLLDLTTPFCVVMAANAANYILDQLLMFGLGWGMAGCGWASVISQVRALQQQCY